jgi:succinyl-diaminopimelate desuccinylase
MDDELKKIINKIDSMKDEIIKFHQAIVGINSVNPPGKYKEISKFVKAKMQDIGLKVKVKMRNVIGEIGDNNGKSLILYGHMDTVEVFDDWTKDPFGAEIIDGKIYGRGACDDKSSVTAMLFAVKTLLELNMELKGKLTLTATIDEELGGLMGAKYLVDEVVEADACLLGDGPAGYPMAWSAGSLFFNITIKGKQTHSALPDIEPPHRNKYSGINAIKKMVKVLNFLNKLQEDFNKKETKHPVPPNIPIKISSINFSSIHAGKKISIVPDKCVLQGSIFTIPEQDIESIKDKIINYIDKLKKEDPDLDINFSSILSFEPQEANINSDFAKVVKNAFKTVYNEERGFRLFITPTDAHHFQEKGIETITIGAGMAECNVHKPDEFVYIENLINLTKIFAISAFKYLR